MGPSGSIRVHPGPSGSIRVHPGPSRSIRVHPHPFGSIPVHPGPSLSIHVHPGLSPSIIDCEICNKRSLLKWYYTFCLHLNQNCSDIIVKYYLLMWWWYMWVVCMLHNHNIISRILHIIQVFVCSILWCIQTAYHWHFITMIQMNRYTCPSRK